MKFRKEIKNWMIRNMTNTWFYIDKSNNLRPLEINQIFEIQEFLNFIVGDKIYEIT